MSNIPNSLEPEMRKKKKKIKKFMKYPSELPTPISKIKRWYTEVILSASITSQVLASECVG